MSKLGVVESRIGCGSSMSTESNGYCRLCGTLIICSSLSASVICTACAQNLSKRDRNSKPAGQHQHLVVQMVLRGGVKVPLALLLQDNRLEAGVDQMFRVVVQLWADQ